MKSFIVTLAIVTLATSVYGQDYFVTVLDTYITLNGTYSQLAGIEAKAPSGLKIGENPNFPGSGLPDVRPFPIAAGNVVANTPRNVVIGVLGAGNRIDIEGVTTTGITYTGEIADLAVNLGIADNPAIPGSLPILPASASAPDVYVDIRDNRIWLLPNVSDLVPSGTLSDLAGIEITSSGGFLGRADHEVTPGEFLPEQSQAPFAFGNGLFSVESPTVYAYSVGGDQTVDVSGPTPTAITYSANLETARSDLTVVLDVPTLNAGRALRVRVVPEPAFSQFPFILVLSSVLLMARHRRTG